MEPTPHEITATAHLGQGGVVSVTVTAHVTWGDDGLSAVGSVDVDDTAALKAIGAALHDMVDGDAGVRALKIARRTASYAEGLAEAEGDRRVQGIRIERTITATPAPIAAKGGN